MTKENPSLRGIWDRGQDRVETFAGLPSGQTFTDWRGLLLFKYGGNSSDRAAMLCAAGQTTRMGQADRVIRVVCEFLVKLP